MYTDYSLPSINSSQQASTIPPLESTDVLDHNDDDISEKQQKITTEKRSRHFSSFICRITNRRNSKQQNDVPRVIYINHSQQQQQQQKFLGNQVSTAKYNPISFLPKFLYVEFSKSANLFFLFISGIQVRGRVCNRNYDPSTLKCLSVNSKFQISHLLHDTLHSFHSSWYF